MHINFDEEEKKDIAIVNEALEKTDTYQEMAKWLTKVWQRKYATEFRNIISLTYDLTEETLTLKCGDNVKTYDENEIGMIAKDLTFFRKEQSRQ